MNSEKMVSSWQGKIEAECARTFHRPLTSVETSFVRSRQGFLALEAIQDSVAIMTPSDLLAYLNSEHG
jgi:hypothetical protein